MYILIQLNYVDNLYVKMLHCDLGVCTRITAALSGQINTSIK